ncbi:hypothetical protein [Hydrogenothermus marinus]|uniref:Uncharacterized protein n=1 Tax=Hydrogenothermus marinus TaxID=133270 RepID=A0A3M0B5Z8_9AQUI|nr:hypothetical protein [Hydrogenothermus marinus]RMA92467.1 hypothetical protein CLV39_1715 [Hydrogenothermus marinus]
MENIYRIILVFVSFLPGLFLEIEYKEFYYVLPSFYITIYFLLKSIVNKYFFIILDALYIIAITYLTGNPYISLFITLFLPFYIVNWKTLLFAYISFLLPLIFSYYLTGYYDFTLIFIFIGFYISSYLYYIHIQNEGRRTLDYKARLLDITAKYDEILKEKELIDISKFENINLKDIKKLIVSLHNILNTKGISIFDIENNKCIHIGNSSCDKELLKYANDKIYYFRKDNEYILVLPIYDEELNKLIYFFYDDESLIENINIFYYLKTVLENDLLKRRLKPIS